MHVVKIFFLEHQLNDTEPGAVQYVTTALVSSKLILPRDIGQYLVVRIQGGKRQYWQLVGGAKDTAKHLTVHWTVPTTKNHPALTINNAEVEKC
jgi:hypothetical protein